MKLKELKNTIKAKVEAFEKKHPRIAATIYTIGFGAACVRLGYLVGESVGEAKVTDDICTTDEVMLYVDKDEENSKVVLSNSIGRSGRWTVKTAGSPEAAVNIATKMLAAANDLDNHVLENFVGAHAEQEDEA